ncbi:hypothetical protein L596_030402 [Steinernema carpocapsae]|uniref:Uncharacterized protein n=1 Tax=Steinernema carpocapsae TaxID=34508 RepID=A0A4U5LPA6_STECR|nr:hypothetical protein L596_030402 [Steinernema carpocapsae]
MLLVRRQRGPMLLQRLPRPPTRTRNQAPSQARRQAHKSRVLPPLLQLRMRPLPSCVSRAPFWYSAEVCPKCAAHITTTTKREKTQVFWIVFIVLQASYRLPVRIHHVLLRLSPGN